jgi:DNA polymerase-3 subunit gamma/tau
MAYTVIARKWRPKTFDEIIGQAHVSRTLKNAIENKRIAHAYLFAGTRGIGKTTTARVMAKALNCILGPIPTPCNECVECREIDSGRAIDVIEIDGASNRGIDEIRELREKAIYTPSRGRYKIYIIDEVHMLTREAFNALLKILEEPPRHVIFMFATTEMNKVPITILSRCQCFTLKRISIQDIVKQLGMICEKEGIRITDEELFLIAKSAEGSMRDAQGLLDQIVSYSGKEVTRENVVAVLGTVEQNVFQSLVTGIHEKNPDIVLDTIRELTFQGCDIGFFLRDLLDFIRGLMITKIAKDPYSLIELPKESVDQMKKTASRFSSEELHQMFDILVRTEAEIGRHADPVLLLEMSLLKLVKISSLKSIDEIMERLERIEQTFAERGSVQHKEKPAANREETKKKEKAFSVPEQERVPYKMKENEDLDKAWEKVIEHSEKKKKWLPSVLMNLSPVSFKDGVLEIGFLQKNSFCKDQVKENKDLISATIHEILGEEISLRINDILIEKKKKEGGDKTVPEEDPEERLLKETLDVFGGDVVRERRIKTDNGGEAR